MTPHRTDILTAAHDPTRPFPPSVFRFLSSEKARPAGFEPATYGFEVRRSIQLSYGREVGFGRKPEEVYATCGAWIQVVFVMATPSIGDAGADVGQ